jgi:hypothetical protein
VAIIVEPDDPSLASDDVCWPVVVLCNDDYETEFDEEIRAYAETLAGRTMRQLTGYSVGGCPITVRPCAARCVQQGAYLTAGPTGAYATPGLGPFINASGAWVNGCGCVPSSCSCKRLHEVHLDSPVGDVVQVKIDGSVLEPAAYRVDDGYKLVRLDGHAWPACQDMAAADTEPGTFSVTYLNARPVTRAGAVAAGVLANEFAKACKGKACSLPRGVTQIVRQGVTLNLETGVFPDRRTGIQAVDAYLDAVNPHKLVTPPIVYSPDLPRPRQTTWP